MSQRAIGGYFELELPYTKEFHSDAISLNSGRFCLEYIFTCDSAIEPIVKLGIPYEFYHIDKQYRIIDNIVLSDNEALMYINYWGTHSEYCDYLVSKFGKQLILDYTQAFFAKPIDGIDTFYSCRKFFGVPDGGYLYTDAIADFEITQDESYLRMDSLIKRIDLSPEAGYEDFRKCSELFHNIPIRYMSNLTKRMMSGIEYQDIASKRCANYECLRQSLGGQLLSDDAVPMIFPYETSNGQELRKRLIEQKIFVAKYWPNVDGWAGRDAVETWMANNILPLPIDQRFGVEDMERIINVIKAIL